MVSWYQQKGGDYVEKKRRAMTVRLPEKLMDELRELSYLTRIPTNQTITRVLEENIPALLERARREK